MTIYIFYSLLLAVLHVCACAVEWKLISTQSSTKPRLVWHLLFVRCTRRSFWLQLIQRIRLCSAPRATRPHSELSVQHPFSAEGAVWFPTESVIPALQNVEQLMPSDIDKSTDTGERKAVEAKKLCNEEEDLHSWEAVAHGVNYVVSAIYLFSNALLFAICMCPLLIRIFYHASVTPYLKKVESPSDFFLSLEQLEMQHSLRQVERSMNN